MRIVPALVLAAALAASASSQTVYTYEYDVFGRLTKTTQGANPSTKYALDDAGNRTTVTNYVNSAPVANDDILYFVTYSPTFSGNIGVLDNDTDIDLPSDTLSVLSVTGSPYASVAGGGVDVYFSGPSGAYTLNYTARDAANAQDTATVSLEIFYCTNPGIC